MKLFNTEKDPLEILKGKYEQFNKALSDLKSDLASAQEKVDSARNSMEAAAEANDSAAFECAKAQLTKAETGLEMAKMRLDKFTEKGPATKEEIVSAIKEYENAVARINAKACRDIIDRITALNEAVDAYNNEARQILMKEKALCELSGIGYNPIMGNLANKDAIYASQLSRLWPSNDDLKIRRDLQRFASQA